LFSVRATIATTAEIGYSKGGTEMLMLGIGLTVGLIIGIFAGAQWVALSMAADVWHGLS
jgi:hypothetical protein